MLVVVGILGLGACGGGGGAPTVGQTSPVTPAPFNQDDVDFAVAMSMHRGQAVTLAEIARGRTRNPMVRKLAARIRAGDGPAVDQIAGWMDSWASAGAALPHHGEIDEGTPPGLVSEQDMARLRRASSTRFDEVLLGLLIAHHRAALPLFDREIARGRSGEARAMAHDLSKLYRSELALMRETPGSAK